MKEPQGMRDGVAMAIDSNGQDRHRIDSGKETQAERVVVVVTEVVGTEVTIDTSQGDSITNHLQGIELILPTQLPPHNSQMHLTQTGVVATTTTTLTNKILLQVNAWDHLRYRPLHSFKSCITFSLT